MHVPKQQNSLNAVFCFGFVLAFFLITRQSFSGLAEDPHALRFKHLGNERGFSQLSVEAIIQDRQGFIWVGTKAGLNKYDGYEFTVYLEDLQDPQSISNNVVSSLVEDKNGDIWVGTVNGLNRYDRKTNRFTRYFLDKSDPYSLSGNNIHDIAMDSKGTLWIVTSWHGLNRYDRDTDSFTRFLADENTVGSICSNRLLRLYIDKLDAVWVSSREDGISILEEGASEFSHIPYVEPGESHGIAGNNVRGMVEDSEGNIWFGTDGEGLFRMDPHGGFTQFDHDPNDESTVSSSVIYDIMIDSKQRFWVCTDGGGLNRFFVKDQCFRAYTHDKYNPSSIRDNVIRTIYEDDASNLWVGVFAGGVDFVDDNLKPFNTLKDNSWFQDRLNAPGPGKILWDRKGRFWSISYADGLTLYDSESKKYKKFKYDKENPNSFANHKFTCIVEGSSGDLWIGNYFGGLHHFDTNTFKTTRIGSSGEGGLSNPSIWAMELDDDGVLWIATAGGGLNRYDTITGVFKNYPCDRRDHTGTFVDEIFTIKRDSHGRLLLGTLNGLNVFYPDTEKFDYFLTDLDPYQDISTAWIFSIHEDSKGRIWLGTNGNGLIYWDEFDNSFEVFGEKDGFASNAIMSIVEDDQSLWLGTNRGITQFDYESKEVANFNRENGLPSREYGLNSGTRDDEGLLYFCGSNGLTFFDPKKLKRNELVPSVVFTDLELFNERVKIGGAEDVLQEHINSANSIRLNPLQSVFTVEFAALNYSSPARNLYSHYLDGFETKWSKPSHSRSVTYTNLDPGTYTLRVKGSNNDGVWNEIPAELAIIVVPPYWRTSWFRSLCVLSVAGVLAGIYLWRVREIRNRSIALEALVDDRTKELVEHKKNLEQTIENRTADLQMAKEKAEHADNLKTAFLANMSHEIRTPLNAILGYANLLRREGIEAKQRLKMVRHIDSNSDSLLGLIDDILDISKIESGNLVINTETVRIQEIVTDLYESFKKIVEYKGKPIDFSLDLGSLPPIEIQADPYRFRQIINNLLQNAVKFTDSGTVSLRLRQRSQSIVISVEDSGIGIDDYQKENIFYRFAKAENPDKRVFRGAGLGLAISKELAIKMGGQLEVESTIGEGSTFSLSFNKWESSPMLAFEPKREVSPVLRKIDLARCRFLVAEDEDSNFSLLVHMLRSTGVQIIRANDGLEAIERYDEDPGYDLILMDVKMPQMDGVDATREIRKRSGTIPIIGLSAFAMAQDRERALNSGMNAYLVKPIFLEELLDVINRLLQRV